MYKEKWFDCLSSLVDFLNKTNIEKNNIISILVNKDEKFPNDNFGLVYIE